MESASKLGLQLTTREEIKQSSILHLSVIPPDHGPRKPSAIICALDTSGSMNNPSNSEKVDHLSVLDLVKHAMKTMILTLNENDYLALVGFESKAYTLLGLTQMTEAGKKVALESVEAMTPNGGTNIWDALQTAIGMISSSSVCKSVNTSLWLFTDGEPNENPPGGIMTNLEKLLDKKSPPCVINTFGFGYSLDSKLLYGIAEIGNGIFCYLPDCNLVGTTFVNCLCNTLSTVAFKCSIEIASENANHVRCIGYPMENNKIEVGAVQYGQSRDFVIRFLPQPGKEPKFLVQVKTQDGTISSSISGYNCPDPVPAYLNYSRAVYNENLYNGLTQCELGKRDLTFLKNLEKIILSLPTKGHPKMKALLADLTGPTEADGRVAKAFSTAERVQRWGAHYVRSIIRAHQIQQCHNFKDPGVQVYGGKLFKELQLKADMVFCGLPPPVQSLKKQHDDLINLLKTIDPEAAALALTESNKAALVADAPSEPVDMQGYNDCSGGCFDAEGMVRLCDDRLKYVKDLVKNDEVVGKCGKAKVVCLVVFPVKKVMEYVEINKVKLTPKHPIKVGGVWRHPNDVKEIKKGYFEYIYNVVLDKNHVLEINGIEVVTLGHEKADNEVVEHQYYGTKKVVEDLRKVRGWEEGKVVIKRCKKVRDPLTGKVTALIQYHLVH
eukprot:TRINITY_DN3995_c0_g1_i1.p1 TRINITY_DN3995_c0_g1~~TRINITY_DN3995_c0_g1_i1.p1  ORF type:complete len:727 (+),score=59.40 TRINITY_DN3995_c0_g1_i1:185-2182(+)